jgi:acetolactate synthase I/II/III large subunit
VSVTGSQDRDDGMTGAESLVCTLINCGIEICFANPGTSEMHFVNALDKIDGIRPVLGLFEGVVTGAADGYARMADKPAATLLHLGPGLGNGLANLHNARKAHSPVVNIVGDHATAHQRFEAPLTSDVEAFARSVSHWVHTTKDSQLVAADAARAVQAARQAPGQIATLIVPADAAWSAADRPAGMPQTIGPSPISDDAVQRVVKTLSARPGKCALLLRGSALRGRGLVAAGRIAAAAEARLVCDTFTPRIEKGAGRVTVERLPYRPPDAQAFLNGIEHLVIVGSQAPIAFFGYPDQPIELTPAGCTTTILAHPHEDAISAMEQVAELLGGDDHPMTIAGGERPELPTTATLNGDSIMQTVAHYLPHGAIISDESLTSGFGRPYDFLESAAPHDHLHLTGGSIGQGMPLATGAAIACPDRKVVNLEGDGSALYTVQALWTQAREQLDVTTIICANGAYKVLNDEHRIVGAKRPGPKAAAMFDLSNPYIDWVGVAESLGVQATRATDTTSLAAAVKSAFADRGPRLIEAVI